MLSIQKLILLSPSIVASFWFFVISFSVFKENRRKFALSFFMLSVVVSITLGFIFFIGDYKLYSKFYILGPFFALSQFPAFYNYVVSLTSERKNSYIFYLKHWIVPLVSTIIAYFVYIKLLSVNERLYFAEEILTGKVDIAGKFKYVFYTDKFLKLMFVISAFFYFHLINKRVNKHEVQILDFFSNTDKVSFTWFKIFRISFFFAFISGVFYHSVDRSFHIKNIWMSVIAFSFLSIFYWVVGYFGNKQIDIYEGVTNNDIRINTSKKYKVDEIDNVKASEILELLEAVIKNKKLHLNEDLTLVDLASVTRIDREVLSFVINNHLKIDFYKYINRKRIEHAKYLLSLGKIISIGNMYKSCGFKSQYKFREVFKEYVGETPVKYRNKILLSQPV